MELTPKQKRFVSEYVNVPRFWSYVDASGGPRACWPWLGATVHGYGYFHVGLSRNSSMLAHRIAYGLSTGENPEAVCHTCDNPPCVNPLHLFGGTRLDNNRDAIRKGRNRRPAPLHGSLHQQAKLSDEAVAEIRANYKIGLASQRQLANAHHVSQRTINKVVRGLSYV